MNQQTTIDKMNTMRLKGMAQVYHANVNDKLYQNYTLDQFIALLIDEEYLFRQNRKTANLIKAAKFRINADSKNIDYTSDRGLDRNNFERLITLNFIKNKENIIITGPTGTGKSYLAQALGHQACLKSLKTKYFTTTRLLDEIILAKIQGTYHNLINKIQNTELLILDDFGLQPFNQDFRQALMDIVEYKYDQSSLIITSQIPLSQWHELIGEGTIADAILDRIIHSSHQLKLKGISLRKNKKISK